MLLCNGLGHKGKTIKGVREQYPRAPFFASRLYKQLLVTGMMPVALPTK